jgi:hypothetical protein
LFSFFLWYWSLNPRSTPWATPPALFYGGFFWGRVSWTVCPGWLPTDIFLISASWDYRHEPVAPFLLFVCLFVCFWQCQWGLNLGPHTC